MVLNTYTMHETSPTYIYESPDGGKTVYRRTSGNLNKEIIKTPDPWNEPIDMLQYVKWSEILKHAKNDNYLKDLLDRAEVYHRLKYESKI
jgi:hypothetical protein